jgi:hypothetical protein
MSHPNLSDDINANIDKSEYLGGYWLKNLPIDGVLSVRTNNTPYFIKRVPVEQHEQGYLLWGHPRICPEPTPAYITGSTWGGTMIKVGFIGKGMYMEYYLKGETYITSTVCEIIEL